MNPDNITLIFFVCLLVMVLLILVVFRYQLEKRIQILESRTIDHREKFNIMNARIDAQNDANIRLFEAALTRHISPIRESIEQTRKEVAELSSFLTSLVEDRWPDEIGRSAEEGASTPQSNQVRKGKIRSDQ